MSNEGRPVQAALRKFWYAGGRRPDDQSQEEFEKETSRRRVEACLEALDAYLDQREAYPDEMLRFLADPYKEKLTGHMPRLWTRLKARAPRETGAEEAECQRNAVLFIQACEVPSPLSEALWADLTRRRELTRMHETSRTEEQQADGFDMELSRIAAGKLPSIWAAVQKRNARQLVQHFYAPEAVPQLDRTTVARWVAKHAPNANPERFQPGLEPTERAHLFLVGMAAEARRYRAIQRNRVRSG